MAVSLILIAIVAELFVAAITIIATKLITEVKHAIIIIIGVIVMRVAAIIGA